MTSWASPPLSTPADEFLVGIRSAVPVKLIATPRRDLRCRNSSEWQTIEADPELSDFDQVPLSNSTTNKIEAVFLRGTGLVPLNEAMFIAADAPLLSFLESADSQTFRFLVDGCEVFGLVTLSDIQKLPVYSILFSLVIATELLLAEWIRKECGTDEDIWLKHLDKGSSRNIERYWERAREKNVDLDRLSYASFGQEIQAAKGLGLFVDGSDWAGKLRAVEELRHRVCHAMEVAPTPEEAIQIPPLVRNAQELVTWLQQEIGDSLNDL